jgi:hypothetical protein
MIKSYVNVVPLAYVILISVLSFDMFDCTLAAIDEINNLWGHSPQDIDSAPSQCP